MSQCRKCGVEIDFLTAAKKVEHDRECGVDDIIVQHDSSSAYCGGGGFK